MELFFSIMSVMYEMTDILKATKLSIGEDESGVYYCVY